MSDVLKLQTKPTLRQDIKAQVVEHLTEALEYATANEVEGLVVIMNRPDGRWKYTRTGIVKTCETIGQLEAMKQEMISEYMSNE